MIISSTFVNLCGKNFITRSIVKINDGDNSYGDVQSPLALDGRLCGTPNNISYSPLRQSCPPLISAFRWTNPPLTFSSTAQSCFSFLLCIHNGNTVLELSPSFYNRLSLRQSCLPLFSAFGCTNPPLTFSSMAQSCFSFLLCIHNGSTVVTRKHL